MDLQCRPQSQQECVPGFSGPLGRRESSLKLTALIAEDDPLLAQFLQCVLTEQAQVEVLASLPDGKQVVSEVLRLEPQILLLDLNLPGCGGLEIVDKLREAGSACRILVLTGASDEQMAVECARRGAHGFVPKQEALSLLPKAIQAVASGEPWYSRRVLGAVLSEYPTLVSKARESERPINQLTAREREVLIGIAQGFTNKEIAAKLFMSLSTVKVHVHTVFQKLGLPNRTEAAVFAVREGLLSGPSSGKS